MLLKTIPHPWMVSEISHGVGIQKGYVSKISSEDGGWGDCPEGFKNRLKTFAGSLNIKYFNKTVIEKKSSYT